MIEKAFLVDVEIKEHSLIIDCIKKTELMLLHYNGFTMNLTILFL